MSIMLITVDLPIREDIREKEIYGHHSNWKTNHISIQVLRRPITNIISLKC